MTADRYHIELKPGPDPYHRRHGINREPIYRLKRLIKYAARECGFAVSWGRIPPPVELVEDREQTEGNMVRFTDGPAAGVTLMLRRAPLYLRVVRSGDAWDALDQLRDVPTAGEAIVVYRRVGEASAVHLDWTDKGKRRGAWFAYATYQLAEQQPDDATACDTAAWRAWCWAQVKKPVTEGTS